jgi:hypothetical protein
MNRLNLIIEELDKEEKESLKVMPTEELEKYLNDKFERIGEGSSRIAYTRQGDDTVIKLAKTMKGKAQNGLEYRVWEGSKNKKILAEVTDHDPHFRWIEMEKCHDAKLSHIEEYYGVKFDELISAIDSLKLDFGGFKNNWWAKEWLNVFRKHPYIRTGDFRDTDQWGKTLDGRVVVVDYGFSNNIRNNYYKGIIGKKYLEGAMPLAKYQKYKGEI